MPQQVCSQILLIEKISFLTSFVFVLAAFKAGKIASNPFANPPPGPGMGMPPRPGMPGFNPMLPPPIAAGGMPNFAPPNFAPPNFMPPHRN